MNISAMIMLAYMALTLGIGFYLTKSNNSVVSFLVAKRGLTVVLIIPLLFGELIGGSSTVGAATEGYNYGIAASAMTIGVALGCALFALTVCKFYAVMGRKIGAMSISEAYGRFFDRRASLVIGTIQIAVFMIVFALQPMAAANIIAPMFSIENKELVAWVMGILFIVLTVTGGLKGLAWMNSIHSTVMYVGMTVVMIVAIHHIGGVGVLLESLPEAHLSMTTNLSVGIAACLGTMMSYIASPTNANISYGAINQKTARKGILLSALILFPFAFIPPLVGMAGRIALAEGSARNALFLMANEVGPVFGGIASMAIIAAIFSTAPAALMIVITCLTRDYFRGVFAKNATDQQELFFSKAAAIVIGLICTYFGLNIGSILSAASGAFQIRSVAGLVLLIALHWKRVNQDSAFWAMVTGGGLAAIWHFAGSPYGLPPLYPSLVLGLVVLVVMTIMNKEPVSEGYKLFKQMEREYDEELAAGIEPTLHKELQH